MGQNKLLPIFLKIRNRPCLVVGGGKIAYQKIRQLIQSEADITVLSDECIDEIIMFKNINWIKSKYNKRYLSGYRLVISATSDNEVNKAVYHDAENIGIPVNIVDQPELCSYYFGSVHTEGDLKIAVSTNGQSPSAAKQIKKVLIKALPNRIDSIINRFSELRKKLKDNMSYEERKKIFDSLAKKDIISEIGTVSIVGAGPGSPDLLTIKAAEVISRADIILYDALIHSDILSLSSENTKKIFVGKRSGKKCINQNTINQMLLEYAQSNKRVVRLKGGDPFLFGRGGEEAIFLRNHHISVYIVPGITSGIGVATQAGIPLTHRDYSQGVLFITGHESDNKEKINWNLVSKLDMTLVIYMGYAKLKTIVSNLIIEGKDPSTPIGLIQKGTTGDEKILIGEISSIHEKIKVEKLETPIIIVIGKVLDIYKYLKDYIEIIPTLHCDNRFGAQVSQDVSN